MCTFCYNFKVSLTWKLVNIIFFLISSKTVATNSVSPECVALKTARSYLPNFSRRGTCNEALGSNSKS